MEPTRCPYEPGPADEQCAERARFELVGRLLLANVRPKTISPVQNPRNFHELSGLTIAGVVLYACSHFGGTGGRSYVTTSPLEPGVERVHASLADALEFLGVEFDRGLMVKDATW